MSPVVIVVVVPVVFCRLLLLAFAGPCLSHLSFRFWRSVPYNMINLHYNDSLDGLRLQHADEMCKHRSTMRAENIRMHSTGASNPITGEAYAPIHFPQAPPPPAALAQSKYGDGHRGYFAGPSHPSSTSSTGQQSGGLHGSGGNTRQQSRP